MAGLKYRNYTFNFLKLWERLLTPKTSQEDYQKKEDSIPVKAKDLNLMLTVIDEVLAETVIADPTGHTGEFLTTDGSTTSWGKQQVSAPNKVLGRLSSGAGDVEELILDTSTSLASNSHSRIPSQQAVKTYVDTAVTGLLDDRGNYDASTNLFPDPAVAPNPQGSGTAGAILKGDLWYITVGGTLGGTAVVTGTSIRALVDTPGQTASNWAILTVGLGYTPENEANKSTDTALGTSDTLYPSQKAVKTYIDTTILSATVPDGDKGDITVTGGGVIWTIDDDTITYAKIQNVAENRLLGRITAGSGNVEEVILDTDITLAANSDDVVPTQKAIKAYVDASGVSDGDKGDITITLGVWSIDDNAVTNVKVNPGIDAAKISTGVVSNTEFDYLNNVSSNIQTQLNGKQATLTNPVTGTGVLDEITYMTSASTISSLNTATYPSKTELSYVKGVTSAIQTQLNTKVTNLYDVVNDVTAGFILADGDFPVAQLRWYTCSNAGAITITIPSTLTIGIGSTIIFEQLGAGQITIAAGGGVTLRGADSAYTSRTQGSVISAVKVAANTWSIYGDAL